MFSGLFQKIALNWVKNNAVELVAQGLIMLVDQYESIQPFLITKSKKFTDDIIQRVYDLNPQVAIYLVENEKTKTEANIQNLIKSVGYHLEAYATKGDQSNKL